MNPERTQGSQSPKSRMYVYRYTYIYMCVCTYIYVYTSIHIYIFSYTRVYTRIYTCVYTHIYIYTDTYILKSSMQPCVTSAIFKSGLSDTLGPLGLFTPALSSASSERRAWRSAWDDLTFGVFLGFKSSRVC